MAAIEAWFQDQVGTASAVSAIIGTRIFPVKIPQDAATPAIVYRRLSTQRTYSNAGQNPLATPTLEARAVATTYPVAKDLADKMRLAASGFHGADGAYNVRRCFLTNEYDDPEIPTFADDTLGYEVVQIWEITHHEVQPSF